MTNLVLLATVFITLNAFAHSYPSRRLNQPTNGLRPEAFTLPTKIDNQTRQGPPLGLQTKIDGIKVIIEYVATTSPTAEQDESDELVKKKSSFISKESESIENKKKKTWKSKIDQLNKWRLPGMENRNFPMVFILRTNEYKK